MKRILICAGIFIVVFAITLVAVFPLTSVAKQEIDRQIALYNIQMTYTGFESGIFSTTMDGISYMGIPVGDLKISYSPLSALTRKVHVTTESDILALDATNKGDELTAAVDADLQRLINMLSLAIPDIKADIKGRAVANASYNLAEMKGKLSLTGTDFEVQTPMMPLMLKSFNAEADLDNTSIIITSFNSEPINIAITGRITINPNETKNSLLDLRAEAMGQKFSIRGRLGRPVFTAE